MNLTGTCDICHGTIAFDDSAHLTESLCPVCNRTIVLISDAERKRRERTAKAEEQAARDAVKFEQLQKAIEDQRRREEWRIETERRRFHQLGSSGAFAGGLVILSLSVLALLWGFAMPTSAPGSDTINLGLLHDRAIEIYVSVGGIVVSLLMFIVAGLRAIIHNQVAIHFRGLEEASPKEPPPLLRKDRLGV